MPTVPPTEQAQAARLELIQRYQGAAYRYLVGALRDLEAADDLFQELALRFVQGAFRNANPEKGRFRDFLRTTLINLISDHRRRRTRMTPQTRDSMEKQIAGAASIPEADRQFIESWRDEILAQSWEALANIDKSRGTNHYVVLRVRVDNPKTTSAVMVQKVNELLQGRKTYGADGFRKALQRARELFANILVDEVAHSLENPGHQ